MKHEFWFPAMKVDEIIVALNGWGFQISEAQIHRPTAEVVQAIYAMCLQQITGITPESLEEPVERALAGIDGNPELYANSLNHNLMLHHLQRLAATARIHDFCMKDIVFPDPERTRLNLSAMVNLIKFAEEREPFIMQLREQAMTAVEERDRVRQQVAELKRKIAEQKAQREAEEPICEALRDENSKASAVLFESKKVQTALMEEVDTLKKEKSSLSRQKAKLMEEAAHATSAVNSTKSRIVQSPERIKRHISDMGVMTQEEKVAVASNESKARVLKMKLDALSAFEKDVSASVKELQAIQKEQILLANAQKKLADMSAELESKHILRDQLIAQVERTKRQLHNAEDKIIRVQQHAEARQIKSQEAIERLKRDYAEMAEERRENDRQVEELKQEASDIERKMAEHLKTSEAELNELLAEYWNLRHETEVYMETLANKLGMKIPD